MTINASVLLVKSTMHQLWCLATDLCMCLLMEILHHAVHGCAHIGIISTHFDGNVDT